jgi:nitroreductase
MNSKKSAKTIYPVNELSKIRWSPRAFSKKTVEKEKVRSILEAARWSPSAGNLQPWRFMIGLRNDETWLKIFECLDEGNKVWVNPVPVLILTIGEKSYLSKSRVVLNGYYGYDTGQAAAHLSIEATYQGLFVHQMAGFDHVLATTSFAIPSEFQPLSVIAIGYIGDPETLPEDLKKRELAERKRKGFNEFVFSGTFGQKSTLFYDE